MKYMKSLDIYPTCINESIKSPISRTGNRGSFFNAFYLVIFEPDFDYPDFACFSDLFDVFYVNLQQIHV